MTYPRIKALHYVVEHDFSIDYSRTESLSRHEASFDLHIDNKRACFTLKESYATVEETREAIGPYIDGWELEAGLQHGPNKFTLRFGGADIEDLDPATGQVFEQRSHPLPLVTIGELRVTEGVPYYPSPSPTAVSFNPDVRSMFDRYMGYRGGRELLATMAYFCLTVLEASTGQPRSTRKAAAKHYAIDQSILEQIGLLTSTKGGARARKAQGAHCDLSQDETCFLDAAVKAIIRRAAEIAHDPAVPRRTITLQDLPRV